MKQQGGVLDFVTREFEVEVLAGRHPRARRGGRHRAHDGPGRAHPRRRHGREVDADQRSRHDARARRRDQGASRKRRRVGGAAPAAGATPAEPEVIKKGKTDKPEKEEGKSLKLVVGLGNPGKEYRDTRHNVGFLVIDELARRAGVSCDREAFGALVGKTFGSAPVMLAKPLTFMNLSGQAVQGLASFHKVEAGRPAGGRRRREPAAGAAARAARRIGGRAQRVQVGGRAARHRSVSAPARGRRRAARAGTGSVGPRARPVRVPTSGRRFSTR